MRLLQSFSHSLKLILAAAFIALVGSLHLTRDHSDAAPDPGQTSMESPKSGPARLTTSSSSLFPTQIDKMAPREMAPDPRRPMASAAESENPSPEATWSKRGAVNTDPAAPGNAFVMNRSRVNIEATSTGGRSTIEVVIAPAEGDAPTTPPSGDRPSGGLSREQQAFRIKWGWATFDKVKRAVQGYDH